MPFYISAFGVSQQLRGPNFTHFGPPTPRVDICGHFTCVIHNLCHVTKHGHSTDTLPPLLVYVVIEGPLIHE